ncbi:CopG family transcriptional regulator [Paenibacillus macerans]|uniref:CopG family transcriptional regulator n=1 Tax=Paenibacillus macerans TaxID=44252 RepID=UPI003D31500D
MADKKMGRPTDNPKPNKITIRIDNDTLKKLDDYCKNNDIERSEGVRRAIHKLDVKK